MNLKLGLTQSRLTDLLHEMTSQCMHTRENTKTSQYQLARGADATCYPGTNIIVILVVNRASAPSADLILPFENSAPCGKLSSWLCSASQE